MLLRREAGATLAATRGNDGAAGAGAHAGAEAVLAGAAAVVGLESPLRHGKLLELGATASGCATQCRVYAASRGRGRPGEDYVAEMRQWLRVERRRRYRAPHLRRLTTFSRWPGALRGWCSQAHRYETNVTDHARLRDFSCEVQIATRLGLTRQGWVPPKLQHCIFTQFRPRIAGASCSAARQVT